MSAGVLSAQWFASVKAERAKIAALGMGMVSREGIQLCRTQMLVTDWVTCGTPEVACLCICRYRGAAARYTTYATLHQLVGLVCMVRFGLYIPQPWHACLLSPLQVLSYGLISNVVGDKSKSVSEIGIIPIT
jgi:hypothetical protein